MKKNKENKTGKKSYCVKNAQKKISTKSSEKTINS